MSVLVSNTSPSVLPYVRVRENPHVTCDEWSWISKLGRLSSGDASSMEAPSPTTNFLAGEGEEGSEVRRREDEERNGSNLKPTEAQYSFGMQVSVRYSKSNYARTILKRACFFSLVEGTLGKETADVYDENLLPGFWLYLNVAFVHLWHRLASVDVFGVSLSSCGVRKVGRLPQTCSEDTAKQVIVLLHVMDEGEGAGEGGAAD